MEYLTDKRLLIPLGTSIGAGLALWYADTEVQSWLNSTTGQVLTPIIGGLAAGGLVFYVVAIM
jgi:hypothetical protein